MRNKGGVKEQLVRAVVTRADGTVEDLGVIARTGGNPIKNLWWKITIAIKRRLKSWRF